MPIGEGRILWKTVTWTDVAGAVARDVSDGLLERESPAATMWGIGKMFTEAIEDLLLCFARNSDRANNSTGTVTIDGTDWAVRKWLINVVTVTTGIRHLRDHYGWPWENTGAYPYATCGWPVSRETAFNWPGWSALHAVIALGELICRDAEKELERAIRWKSIGKRDPRETGLTANSDIIVAPPRYEAMHTWQALFQTALRAKVGEASFPSDRVKAECERIRLLIDEEYRQAMEGDQTSGKQGQANKTAQNPSIGRRSKPMSMAKMMRALKLDSPKTLKAWLKDRDLQEAGNRQTWTICIDGLDPDTIARLERV